MAGLITDHIIESGMKVMRGLMPSEIKRIEDDTISVKMKSVNGNEEIIEKYNTVLLAVGNL